MSIPEKQSFDAALPAMLPALRVAYQHGREHGVAEGIEIGRQEGFAAGRQLGFVEGVNALTAAVSDGLRHGSPVCGSVLQGMKNLGLSTDDSGLGQAAAETVLLASDGEGDIDDVCRVVFIDH